MECLKGVGVALVTPFKECGDVDYCALKRLVNFVIEGGVDYLVALGTTAETATLNSEEKSLVLKTITETNGGKKPIVVGIGGNNTAEVCRQISEFDFSGISALLSVVPYYNKPSQEGIFQHYKAVCESSPIPVILYNVPGRTGVNMSAQTTIRIAKECKNAAAVKEASGNLGQTAYILRDRQEGFLVLSGDDNLALPMIAQGGDGVISVAANSFPKTFTRTIHGALNGEFANVQKDYASLVEVTDLLFAEGNPAGVKAALSLKGITTPTTRLPLVAASESLTSKIADQIAKYSL